MGLIALVFIFTLSCPLFVIDGVISGAVTERHL